MKDRPSNTLVAFFYFKDDDKKTRSFHQALCDMAYTLAQTDQNYDKFLLSRFDSRDNISSLSSAWRNLVREYFIQQQGDSHVILVLDGIDEAYAKDREEFFDLARDIEDGGRIQLAMLGRFQIFDEIAQTMELPDVLTIPITPASNYVDIAQYVDISISKSAFLRRASPAMRAQIVDKICSKAQGMFIWVDLMLKDILKRTGMTGWNAILNVLDRAPRGIDKMIRHVLEGYSTSFQGDLEAAGNLNEMLAWVACTESPLTLSELEEILRWRSGPESDMIWLERTLRIQFASILVLIREDGLTTADLHRAEKLPDAIDAGPDSEGSTFGVPGVGVDDIDNPTEFDSDPATTKVTFSHASIGDFFRDEKEGMVVGDDGSPAVGVNIQAARVHCLTVCLDVLCQQAFPSADVQSSQVLVNRCRISWLQYLTNVDITKLQAADKERVGGALAKLLLQDHDMSAVVTSLGFQTVLTQENAELLWKWLDDADVQASLPEELREAYQSQMKDNALDVFLRTIRRIGKVWLLELSGDPVPFCWFIVQFRKLRYGTEVGSELTAPVVIEAAEWCELEKKPLWYRRLAMTLRNIGAFAPALEYFERVIELDPPGWRARQGIAICYQNMGDVQQLIKYDEKLLADLKAAFPEMPDTADAHHTDHFHDVYKRLAGAYGQLDQLDKALEHYRSGVSRRPNCLTCLQGTAGILNLRERWDDLFALYRDLDEKPEYQTPGKEASLLLRMIGGISGYFYGQLLFLAFVAAAEHTGNTAFLLDAHRRAAAVARRERRFVALVMVEYLLSLLLAREGDIDGAARICERIVLTYLGTSAERFIAAVLLMACYDLSMYCLIRVSDAPGGTNSVEAKRHGAMIEWLVAGAGRQSAGADASLVKRPDTGESKSADSQSNKNDRYSAEFFKQLTTTILTMGMAQYYQLCGRHEEAQAVFRTLVGLGLQMLSDDDPANDNEAYTFISYPLAAVHDDVNAMAIYYRLVQNKLGKNGWGEDPLEAEEEKKQDDMTDAASMITLVETTTVGTEAAGITEPPAAKAEIADATVEPTETTVPEPEKKQTLRSSVDGEDDEPYYLDTGCTCDACLRRRPFANMYVCRFCIDKTYCPDCIAQLKAGTLPVRVCSPRHDWVVVQGWPMADRSPPEPNMMRVKGEWVDFEEWKESIRKKWEL